MAFIADINVFDRSLYESTTPQGKTSGILRKIRGPVSEWDSLNRNKRKYSERLWDRTLESPYVVEQLKYHTLYGEANHPQDRFEVDFSRVSHSITNMWKVPASNQVYADIAILDTPMGRILNTLYEAGGIIGYSSRAGGTLNPKKGYTEVDENTYNFVTFDAVPFPSVESARPPIVEGVEQIPPKVNLPDSVHDALCQIISESGSSCRDAMKDFIYSLEGYDLSREIALIEGSNSVVKSNPIAETTMFLLKENSLQIDRLRSENQTLQASKVALEEENKSLRESLDTSVSNLKKAIDESKNADIKVQEAASMSDDTIRGLREQIIELRGDIQERDIEIDRLSGIQEAVKALQIENRGLRSEIETIPTKVEENADLKDKLEAAEAELDAAIREVALLISEAEQRDSEIKRLTESAEESQRVLHEMQDRAGEMSKELALQKSQTAQLNESTQRISTLEAEKSDIISEKSSLESEISTLREQLNEAQESFDMIASKSDKYRDELISVIASGYNLTVESVRAKLPVGFSKSDVYSVCEQLTNNANNSFPNIVSVAEETKPAQKSIQPHPTPKIEFVNRRGIK